MKPLLLSTTDSRTGASAAAYRLLKSLNSSGVDAKMLVASKTTNDDSVYGPSSYFSKGLSILRPTIDQLALGFYDQSKWDLFSPQWVYDGLYSSISSLKPDVLNLHWVCGGFFRIETLSRFKIPVILSAHDLWTFTGGCHYDGGCGEFENMCGNCPVLASKKSSDLSSKVLKRKHKNWRNMDITVVGGTNWVASMAKKSSLYKAGVFKNVEVIPLAIDETKFRPVDKPSARNILNIPISKKVIFFGATHIDEPRKGMSYLSDSLSILRNLILGASFSHDDVLLLVAGKGEPGFLKGLPFEHKEIGYLGDDTSLALAYQASDVYVCPSIEDAGPTMVAESMLCGTPVVAFDTGGIPDFFEHKVSGYLAVKKESSDLAKGLFWVLNDVDYKYVSSRAVDFALKRHSSSIVAKQYENLYRKVLHV